MLEKELFRVFLIHHKEVKKAENIFPPLRDTFKESPCLQGLALCILSSKTSTLTCDTKGTYGTWRHHFLSIAEAFKLAESGDQDDFGVREKGEYWASKGEGKHI